MQPQRQDRGPAVCTGIEETPVRLRRADLTDLPDWPLSAGYRLRGLGSEDVGSWCALWRQAHPSAADRYRPDYFALQFGDDWEAIARRCLILEDPAGQAIGTASAWHGDDGPQSEVGRVHWVALRPCCQGRGLSRPLLAAVLRRLADLGHRSAYLDTQAHRSAAIALYLSAGFRPDCDHREDAAKTWAAIAGRIDHPALTP